MGYGAWSMCYHFCPCLRQTDQEATPTGPSFALGLTLGFPKINKPVTFHSGNLQRVHLSSGVRMWQRLIVVDGLSLIDSVGFASRKVTSVGDYRVL